MAFVTKRMRRRQMYDRRPETDPRFTFHASRFTVLWSDARTTLTDFFSTLLEPLFLEIVDVEPHVDRAMVRHELGNVLLQVLLGLETHVAEPGIAHGIIPLQDHIRVGNLCGARDPFGDFFVSGSRRATTSFNCSGVIPVNENHWLANEQGQ
jgi:hypothetical protein